MKRRRAPEKAVQRRIRAYLDALGAEVWDTSQPFQAYIRAGLPDIIAFVALPPGELHLLFWESKAPGEKPTLAQAWFGRMCEAVGAPVHFGWGDVAAFEAWLCGHGLAERRGPSILLTPCRKP